MATCEVYWMGRVPYGEALELQRQKAAARRRGEAGDCLLLLEHPAVITLGRGGKREHLRVEEEVLEARGIEVWDVERGGDVTFHGPGQLVGYPILDLIQHGGDLHRYARQLEEVVIRTLRAYGIDGQRSAGRTGVWVRGAKIASIGVHVSRWVSRHGFALNVSTDLGAFDLIIPCGLRGIRMISMATLLGREVPVQAVAEEAAHKFGLVFDCIARWRTPAGTTLSIA